MTPTFIHPRMNKPPYPRNKYLGLHDSSFVFCSNRSSFVPVVGPLSPHDEGAPVQGRGHRHRVRVFSALSRSLARLLSLCFSLFLSLVLSLALVFSLSFALVLPSLVPFPIVFCCSAPNLLSVAMIFCFSYFLSVVFATKTLS
jgi:hypothetical protein